MASLKERKTKIENLPWSRGKTFLGCVKGPRPSRGARRRQKGDHKTAAVVQVIVPLLD